MHAEGARIIPAGMIFRSTVFVCTGFGKSRIPRDFMARERKTTGNQTFPRELFGWERDIKVSSGTVWMGSRERYLHGNGKKKTFLVKYRGKFPAGMFPRKALQISIHVECENQYASSQRKLVLEAAELCSWSQWHSRRAEVRNHFIHLQLQQTGDEAGDPPG